MERKAGLLARFFPLLLGVTPWLLLLLWMLSHLESNNSQLPYLFVISIVGLIVCFGTIDGFRAYKRSRQPCIHGVSAKGHCVICKAEGERLRADREAKVQEETRRRTIRDAAEKLREEEITRLSTAWLNQADSYLTMTPRQFEDAIAELFKRLGYRVQQTPFTNDGGKDAIAWKDGKKVLIECKRYGENKLIGRRDLQIFMAAMLEEKADEGFYINTGLFSTTAYKYAEKNRITLYNRATFPDLVSQAYPKSVAALRTKVMCLECGSIILAPVAVSQSVSSQCPNGHLVAMNIGRMDLNNIPPEAPTCDRCGSPMRLLRRRRFWGCSRYPICRSKKYISRVEFSRLARSNFQFRSADRGR